MRWHLLRFHSCCDHVILYWRKCHKKPAFSWALMRYDYQKWRKWQWFFKWPKFATLSISIPDMNAAHEEVFLISKNCSLVLLLIIMYEPSIKDVRKFLPFFTPPPNFQTPFPGRPQFFWQFIIAAWSFCDFFEYLLLIVIGLINDLKKKRIYHNTVNLICSDLFIQ